MRPSIACALLTLALAVPASAAPEAKKSAPTDDSARIAEKLLDRMDIAEPMKVPLREVLDLLHKRTGLSILIDYKAFAARTSPEEARPDQFNDAAITLPAMKGVRVETILRAVADQLDADFLIAPDHVRITTPAMKDLVTGQARALPDLYPGDIVEAQVDRNEVVIVTPERAKEMEGDLGPRVALGGFGGAGGVMTLGELETIARLFANKPADAEAKRKELEEKIRKLTEELEKVKK